MEDIIKEVRQGTIIIIPNRDLPFAVIGTESEHTMPHTSYNSQSVNQNILHSRINRSHLFTQRRSMVRRSSIGVVSQNESQHRLDTQFSSHLEHTIEIDDTDDEASPQHTQICVPEISNDAEVHIVNIIRSSCVDEIFNIHKDPSVVEKKLSVLFIGEEGIDGGGLTNEFFNLFFNKIEMQYFRGEECIVSYLELNKVIKEKDRFVIIGRILQHMLLLTGCFPTKLGLTTLLSMSNRESDITPNILLEDLLKYVNPCERAIFKKALDSFNTLTIKEKEVLSNTFTSYQFYEMPKEEVREQLLSIATDVLLTKPKQFIDLIRSGLSLDKYSVFWNNCDFEVLISLQKPTASKIINCLKTPEHLTNEQSAVLHFLEMYIRCLDSDNLRQFVFFVTGSYQMPLHINIEFNNLTGLSRRPIVSTCSNILHLSGNYTTYQDLKRDLNAYLMAEEAYTYTQS